jgi:hypothetical protein
MKPLIVHLGFRLLDPSWDSSKHHQRLLQTIKELLQTPSTSQRQIQVSLLHTETLPETTESGPLCITDLFQNKSVAYF